MHLILTGATGLVGSGVLHSMLNTPAVTKVSVLSRRPVPMAEGHSKANVIITQDYENYSSEILQQLKDAEGVVWAQGISQTKVGKEYVCGPPFLDAVYGRKLMRAQRIREDNTNIPPLLRPRPLHNQRPEAHKLHLRLRRRSHHNPRTLHTTLRHHQRAR